MLKNFLAILRWIRERSVQLVLPHHLQGRASRTSSVKLTGSVTTINATCQVADQIVKLQSIAAAQLNGVGTYAAVTPFNLAVAGYLRGYYRVGYNLQAVGGVAAEASGVLPRLAGSSATGVSIRVTDEVGAPLRTGEGKSAPHPNASKNARARGSLA
ncbi:fimbrial protein [Pseudomonas aeruginosa]